MSCCLLGRLSRAAGALHGLDGAEDAGERGPQLVRDGRDELALLTVELDLAVERGLDVLVQLDVGDGGGGVRGEGREHVGAVLALLVGGQVEEHGDEDGDVTVGLPVAHTRLGRSGSSTARVRPARSTTPWSAPDVAATTRADGRGAQPAWHRRRRPATPFQRPSPRAVAQMAAAPVISPRPSSAMPARVSVATGEPREAGRRAVEPLEPGAFGLRPASRCAPLTTRMAEDRDHEEHAERVLVRRGRGRPGRGPRTAGGSPAPPGRSR